MLVLQQDRHVVLTWYPYDSKMCCQTNCATAWLNLILWALLQLCLEDKVVLMDATCKEVGIREDLM